MAPSIKTWIGILVLSFTFMTVIFDYFALRSEEGVLRTKSDPQELIEYLPHSNFAISHQEPLGLCVFVHGTTSPVMDRKHEIDDLIRLYDDLGMNERHVFYFMDRMHPSQGMDSEEFCSKRRIRCVFIEYPKNEFSFKAKTFAMFDYVQKHKIYEQCDFMMKLDSDAYVDIPAYSAFLHYQFRASDNHYSGQVMACKGKFYVQGTYVLSRGIFANGNDINFIRDQSIGTGCGVRDDAFVGAYLSIYKNISMTNTRQHTLGYADEEVLRVQWDDAKKNGKDGCLFVCHKCLGTFRERFATAPRDIEKAGSASCTMGKYPTADNKPKPRGSKDLLPDSNFALSDEETVGLCVFVQGTTTSVIGHKHEIDDLIRLYDDFGMNERHVFYFMDRMRPPRGVDPEEFCKNRRIRCVFIEYPKNEFSFKAKTFAMFDYVQEHNIHEQCDFMMKLDSDAYVDIPAYSAFLHYQFRASDDHYSGQLMGCKGFFFIQGTYVLSRGVFTNGHDIDFTRDKNIDPGCGIHDDAFVGTYLSVYKNISITNTQQHTLGYADEEVLRVQWDKARANGKDGCLFVCHKCTGIFREEFATTPRDIEKAGNASCTLAKYPVSDNKPKPQNKNEKPGPDKTTPKDIKPIGVEGPIIDVNHTNAPGKKK